MKIAHRNMGASERGPPSAEETSYSRRFPRLFGAFSFLFSSALLVQRDWFPFSRPSRSVAPRSAVLSTLTYCYSGSDNGALLRRVLFALASQALDGLLSTPDAHRAERSKKRGHCERSTFDKNSSRPFEWCSRVGFVVFLRSFLRLCGAREEKRRISQATTSIRAAAKRKTTKKWNTNLCNEIRIVHGLFTIIAVRNAYRWAGHWPASGEPLCEVHSPEDGDHMRKRIEAEMRRESDRKKNGKQKNGMNCDCRTIPVPKVNIANSSSRPMIEIAFLFMRIKSNSLYP